LDGSSKWVFSAQEGHRGGRPIPLRTITETAVAQCPSVQTLFVYRNGGAAVEARHAGHDNKHYGIVSMDELIPLAQPYCPAATMDAEDYLFLLYTSGSTGKPKGLAHTTAGYLLMASLTHKYVFDVRPGDVYACVADAGWITGHSYVVYGPLINGASTFMFESTPLYPDAGRYWDMVARHKITQFYTAPTAIRAVMRYGDSFPNAYDLSSLRVLGSVGEPINPEAWRWYYSVIGKERCSIVDTFWQTESGGIMITPLPGATPMKPGSATLPFFGIQPELRSKDGGAIVEGNGGVSGILCISKPWPGIARTIYKDHERYLATYLRPFQGVFFTGDGAIRDKDGYYWITGRVDDVLNVSGHRIGSAEVESALVAHAKVSEAAVVGFPHDIKGEGICCYVTLKHGVHESFDVATELKFQVRSVIGAFAAPDLIVLTSALPKTRSGKIMRRILRKVASGEGSFIKFIYIQYYYVYL
jgi:acetyl-CoA synthetase